MNCLIENIWKQLHKGTFQKKIIYVHPNELPNWKRIHKGNFPHPKKNIYVHPNELLNWKRIHKGNFPPQKKITYVLPNELPNWKRILKGKKWKNRGKKLAYFIRGGLLIFFRELAYFILGGLLIPCWHYFFSTVSQPSILPKEPLRSAP